VGKGESGFLRKGSLIPWGKDEHQEKKKERGEKPTKKISFFKFWLGMEVSSRPQAKGRKSKKTTIPKG